MYCVPNMQKRRKGEREERGTCGNRGEESDIIAESEWGEEREERQNRKWKDAVGKEVN